MIEEDQNNLRKTRNSLLIYGGLVFLYGLGLKLYSGYFCSACLIIAPTLLSLALYKHLKLKLKKLD